MSDRQLLEDAAKAAGIEIHESDDGTLQRRPIWACYHYVQGQPYSEVRWDPLNDDAQALRLAVKLYIHITISEYRRTVCRQGDRFRSIEEHGDDKFAATRRAIVRAAAAISSQNRGAE